MHISLTPSLVYYVREKVNDNGYSNVSEVIREALRRMQRDDELLAIKYQALKDSVWIGGEQAIRGEMSRRTALDILEDSEAALDR